MSKVLSMIGFGGSLYLKDKLKMPKGYTRRVNARRDSEQPNFSEALKATFQTLGKILEEEKIEILKTGFRLNQEGKISLKKYYESRVEYSLFQFKGYSIKYESIRHTKLYKILNQNFKE